MASWPGDLSSLCLGPWAPPMWQLASVTHAGKTDVSVLSDLTVSYVTGVQPVFYWLEATHSFHLHTRGRDYTGGEYQKVGLTGDNLGVGLP